MGLSFEILSSHLDYLQSFLFLYCNVMWILEMRIRKLLKLGQMEPFSSIVYNGMIFNCLLDYIPADSTQDRHTYSSPGELSHGWKHGSLSVLMLSKLSAVSK